MTTVNCITKKCKTCCENKPATTEYFYRHKSCLDGLEGSCKACRAAYFASPERKEAEKQSVKKWRQTPSGKSFLNRKNKRRAKEQPEKHRARVAVHQAVKTGKLPKVSTLECAHCDQRAEDYHHWSYEREDWLDVIPLCKKCHRIAHGQETVVKQAA